MTTESFSPVALFDSFVDRLVSKERTTFTDALAAQHARQVLATVTTRGTATHADLAPIESLFTQALSAVSSRYDEHCALALANEAQRLARRLGCSAPLSDNELVRDTAARQRWCDAFGSDALVACTDEVLLAVLGVDPRTDDDDGDVVRIRSLLDAKHVGLCSTYALSAFVELFGPLERLVSVVADTFARPWFFGYLTKRDCECHLASKPTFTFLVRLDSNAASRENALAFHICFRHDNLSIHIRIDREHNGLRLGQPVGPRHDNLVSLVHEYRVWLAIPCRNNFVAVPGWVHELRQLASFRDILHRPERRPGDFALGFSETDGNVAFAFVDNDSVVQWACAQRVVDDSLVFNRIIYSTVHEFVDDVRQRGTFLRPTADTLQYARWRLSTLRTQLAELCVALQPLALDAACLLSVAHAAIATLVLMPPSEQLAVVAAVHAAAAAASTADKKKAPEHD